MNSSKRRKEILELFAEHLPQWEYQSLPLNQFSKLDTVPPSPYFVPTVRTKDLLDIHCEITKKCS